MTELHRKQPLIHTRMDKWHKHIEPPQPETTTSKVFGVFKQIGRGAQKAMSGIQELQSNPKTEELRNNLLYAFEGNHALHNKKENK